MLGCEHQDAEMPSAVQEASGSSTAQRTVVRGSSRALARQLAQFTGIGFVMTLGYLGLYVALRGSLGAQGGNVVAWVATAMLDTAANRWLTFGVRGRRGAARAQVEGLLVFGTGLLITSGSLLAVDALVAAPTAKLQLGALALANLVAGLLRFLLLRHWVFAPRRQAGRPL
jgi:putative flippase GtrA